MSTLSVADSSELPSVEESLELALRARAGDRVAVGQLLKRYEDRLRRIVQIRLGHRLQSQIESMDIVQSAFVVAIRRFDDIELRDRASVLKWLTRVAEHQVNDAVDHFRARKRGGGREQDAEGSGFEPPAADTPPDQAAARNEFRGALDRAVAELSERYREVVLLRDYHDGDWEFVAREIGAPSVEAAQRTYHRAWARLRESLAPYLVDKGSIAVDGISLTMCDVRDASFCVALIPHTFEVTTLSRREPGDAVNLEADMLARYARRALEFETRAR